MSEFWITFQVVCMVMLADTCTALATQSLTDKDVTKEVLHRLDELERQVKEHRVEIEKLRVENVELKTLRKYDSEVLRGQNVELWRLRDANVKLGREIDILTDRDTQLVARINLLENRDKEMSENINGQQTIYHEADPIENKVGSDSEKGVRDDKTNKSDTTDDKRGIVTEYRENPSSSRIRRNSVQGQTIAFFATRSSSHAEHLGQHQAVVFDKTVTNVGQGYHNTAGIFTAPVSGVYVFSTTLFTYNEGAHFQFVINGQAYTTMYSHSTEVYETMSQTVIFNLVKGDDVAIQNLDSDKMVHGYSYSTFSGFLLVSTENSEFVG